MHPIKSADFRNDILAALPPDEAALLRPHLVRSLMVSGQVLHEAGERMDQVYFFERGFASVVAVAEDGGAAVEVGITGRDGMLGLPAALNPAALSFNQAMVQMPGFAHRVAAPKLFECLGTAPALRALLHRGLEVHLAQVSQSAACVGCHSLAERCARWLLAAHDRADGDELQLTQEFLSKMLAVRRAGVTVAMQALEAAGLVRGRRGRVLVCDRAGLERAACGCYGRVRAFGAAVAGSWDAAGAPGAASGPPGPAKAGAVLAAASQTGAMASSRM